VPATFYVEIAQAILRAERRKRITGDQVMRVVETVNEMPLAVHVPSVGLTIALARKYTLSAYDATYLAVAIETDLSLATLDGRLAAAAKSEKRLWMASRHRLGSDVSYLIETRPAKRA
jgi:predicted nucleic acid-binding protein